MFTGNQSERCQGDGRGTGRSTDVHCCPGELLTLHMFLKSENDSAMPTRSAATQGCCGSGIPPFCLITKEQSPPVSGPCSCYTPQEPRLLPPVSPRADCTARGQASSQTGPWAWPQNYLIALKETDFASHRMPTACCDTRAAPSQGFAQLANTKGSARVGGGVLAGVRETRGLRSGFGGPVWPPDPPTKVG